MDLTTLKDYNTMVRFAKFEGADVISLDTFEQLLQKAEQLHQENQWLYTKLNNISGVIEQARDILVDTP